MQHRLHPSTPGYLGPTSTWSFCRRALSLLEAHTPSSDGSTAPLNLDGTAFRLRWEPKSMVEASDLKNLPAMDYALYLYNTVKFHLGELFGVIDEANFLVQFDRFHANPMETARSQRLWFTEYLLILAYGKAFLASGHWANGLPGTEFAERAMALLPDPALIHDESMLGIEVLALVALYFQSIDMRVAAYQYIGQALRLAYVEGIHRQVSDDVISPDFAKRCNNMWWTVYVLDQEFSALMGVPPAVPEGAVTVSLPSDRSSSLPAKALTLRIRLSRLIAIMCSSKSKISLKAPHCSFLSDESALAVYGLEEGLGGAFVRSTTTVLHQLAEVARELDDVVSNFSQTSKSDMPHMVRHISLSYHHVCPKYVQDTDTTSFHTNAITVHCARHSTTCNMAFNSQRAATYDRASKISGPCRRFSPDIGRVGNDNHIDAEDASGARHA